MPKTLEKTASLKDSKTVRKENIDIEPTSTQKELLQTFPKLGYHTAMASLRIRSQLCILQAQYGDWRNDNLDSTQVLEALEHINEHAPVSTEALVSVEIGAVIWRGWSYEEETDFCNGGI